MFVPLVACLKKMCDNDATKSWDRETITKAIGHLNTLSSSDFIAAFETVRFCFLYTHDMSKLLQGTAMDVVWAYEEVKTKQQQLQKLRNDCDTVFREKV